MIERHVFINKVKKQVISKIIAKKPFIIAANWKMNQDTKSTLDFIIQLKNTSWHEKNNVIICPSSPYLFLMKHYLKDSMIEYGVQNLHWADHGAYTGEISAEMARDFGCQYAVIGHSERRTMFQESNEMIAKKIKTCMKYGIKPFLCIGESLDERKNNLFKERLRIQIITGLSQVQAEEISNIVIAYEPVWAIGTGVNASAEEVEDTHQFIQDVLLEQYGCRGQAVPIIYGGSVKPHNASELAIMRHVSGFLVGGASLKIKDFKQIIRELN